MLIIHPTYLNNDEVLLVLLLSKPPSCLSTETIRDSHQVTSRNELMLHHTAIMWQNIQSV